MKQIFIPGCTNKEFISKQGKLTARCFLCKIESEQKSIYFLQQDKETIALFYDIGFSRIDIIKDEDSGLVDEPTKFSFYICQECMLLMEALQDKFRLMGIPE